MDLYDVVLYVIYFSLILKIIFPSSLPVVYALPKPQAQDVISKSPKLKAALKDFMDALPPHQKHRREFKTLLPLVQ